MIRTKRILVVGGVVAALAVPTTVAMAATSTPGPNPPGTSTTQPYGPGPGFGRMTGGGHGNPQDCPYYDSAERQQLRDQRQQLREEHQKLSPAQRLQLMQRLHDRTWAQTPSA